MKRLLAIFGVLLFIAATVQAQGTGLEAQVSEVSAIIEEHTPFLEEYQATLGEHKVHLEERIIVLKYHKANKEVIDACAGVVRAVEEYYNNVTTKVQEYESVWFDQSRNMIAIYTQYGVNKEATGGGANDLQGFADKHSRYLDLLENLKSDLIGVYTDLSYIKNSI